MTKYILTILIVLIGLLVIYLAVPNAWRMVKSVWLIVRTEPYEQTVPNAGQSQTILVAGDSTAYGTGVHDSVDSIAGRIGRDFPAYSIVNVAKNAITTQQLRNILHEIRPETPYGLVLLQIGANDTLNLRPLPSIEADMRAVLADASRLGERVVFMSAGNAGGASALLVDGAPDPVFEEHTRKVRALFMQLAQEHGISYVDLFDEPEDDPFLQEPQTYLALDGLHPSGAGYGLWYERLRPVLKQIFY